MMVVFRRYRWFVFSAVTTVVLISIGYAWYCYTYPFGRSHCCDKQLYFALLDYADRNEGKFPAGEATPEASLSLIHHTDGQDYANLLCGKTGSEAVTKELLEKGLLLNPETCGWHYVEGLHSKDDPRLALFWDKEGLGHNGERLLEGGHIVMFLTGHSEHITAKNWNNFLSEQDELYATRKDAND